MIAAERTAKKWKFLMLAGRATILFGMWTVLRVYGHTEGDAFWALVEGVPYFVIGLGMGWIGKLGAFWFYG